MASLAVAILLLSSMVIGVTGPAVGQASTRQATLHVEQPHYISQDVTTQTDNQTQVYVAKGEVLDLYPQNFSPSQVQGYSVVTSNATLSYQSATDSYRLDPEAPGTYRIRWIVTEPVENRSEPREVVYETRVRVTGGFGLVHRKQGAEEEMRRDAQNWREFNSTLKQRDLIAPGGLEPTLETMIRWFELHPSNNPFQSLTGGVLAYIIIGVTGTAVLVWVAVFGGHAWIVRTLRRQNKIHEATEAEEGTAKEAVAKLEHELDLRTLQNMDWQDIPGFDDHIASAFRKLFGETVGEGAVGYLNAMLPRRIVDDRLQAMGHDGWYAVITDIDGEQTVELNHEDEKDRRTVTGDVVDLATASESERERVRKLLDWDDTRLRTFSLTDAEYDPKDLETTIESADLQSLIATMKADMQHFEDEAAYGEYMREFLATVEESPLCDDEGRPDELRYLMSHFLRLSQLLDDRFDFPLIGFHRDAWERAVQDFDPEREARDAIDRVQSGGAVGD